MNKITLVTLTAAVSLLTGCGTFKDLFFDSPYQAGRTVVFLDTVTEPFQPEEVSKVLDQVYVIAEMNLEAELFLDELVRAEIERMYKDSTPETREVIFNTYKALFAKLTDSLESNPDLPQVEVLSEFFRGVRDALEIYQPEG